MTTLDPHSSRAELGLAPATTPVLGQECIDIDRNRYR